MIGKNLKYHRLKRELTKKELAARIDVTPMAITNYESDKRMPDLKTARKLADALDVKLADLMAARTGARVYTHAEFRKNSSLTKAAQEYVRESVEDYFDRFFAVIDILGDYVLPDAPPCRCLHLSGDIEADARRLRAHLGFAERGPIGNLTGALENMGVLVCWIAMDNDRFSGMNGMVDSRPYVAINANMTCERQRSTLAHELAHLFFCGEGIEEKEMEAVATAISGAFLFPKADAQLELGLRRKAISSDMPMVAREYGISMLMLAKRAQVLGIIGDSAYKDFMVKASMRNWRKREPSRIPPEKPMLFEQLVMRAVGEDQIGISRAAELLRVSYADMARMMRPAEEG